MSDNTRSTLRREVDAVQRPLESDYANEIRLVRTSEELHNAFAKMTAGQGGIIELAAGVEPFRLRALDYMDRQEDSPVLIRSADPENPATLLQAFLRDRENIAIENVEFHATRDEIGRSAKMFEVQNSSNISLFDSVLSSDAAGAAGLWDDPDADHTIGASAVQVRDSDGVVLAGLTIENVDNGIGLMESSGVIVSHTEITRVQSDAIRLAGVQDVEIKGNWIHDLYGSTQIYNHSDMIQFWGRNTRSNTENVRIDSNILDVGDGPSYQMIFGHNEDHETNGWLFDGITVENNVLVGGTYHRISLSNTQNMVVRNNTVISQEDGYSLNSDGTRKSHGEGWIKVNGVNPTIEGNIAIQIPADDGSNAIITLEEQAEHFVNLEAGASGDLRDLQLRPDSELNGAFGSDLLWTEPSSQDLVAMAMIDPAIHDKSLVHLDAGLSYYTDGPLGEGDARFEWTFSDGTTARGISVEHDFRTAGTHGYTLRVTHRDGSVDVIERTVKITPEALYEFAIENGRAVNTVEEGGSFSNSGQIVTEGDAIVIADGQVPMIGRWNDGMFSLDNFDFGLTLDPAQGKSGIFMMIHNAMAARVSEDGAVTFAFTTDEGKYTARTEAGLFDEGARHLNFVYDSQAGAFEIFADGELVAKTSASGTTLPGENWGVHFGRIWGGTLEAEISNIRLAQEAGTAQEVMDRYLRLTGQAVEPEETTAIQLFDAGEVFAEISSGSQIPEGCTVERLEQGGAFNIASDKISFARSHDWIFEASSFDIGFDATLLDANSAGSILHLYRTLSVDLNADGRMVFSLTTDAGKQTIITDRSAFADGENHRVNIGYDAQAGKMQILVDGAIEAIGDQQGLTPPAKYWSLNFGHTWDRATPNMEIDNIEVRELPRIGGSGPQPVGSDTVADVSADLLIEIGFDGTLENDAGGLGVAELTRGELAYASAGGTTAGVFDGDDCVSFSRDLDFLHELDSFGFDLRIKTDGGAHERVLNLHKTLRLDIRDDDLVFELVTDEGAFEVRSEGDVMADGAFHDVEVGYSNAEGLLILRVDGDAVDAVDASGTTAARKYWGLDFGTPWGGDLHAEIDHFTMSGSAAWDLVA